MKTQTLELQNKNRYTVNLDSNKRQNEKTEKKNNDENKKGIVDKFEKGDNQANINYKKPVYRVDQSDIERIKNETDQINKNLRDLVEKLLKKQGLTFKDLDLAIEEGRDLNIEIDDDTRAKAQSMIDEEGPLSVESVSNRIVDFAKAISGGDTSKFDLLKGAIEDGFKEAEKRFGGELPEISHKTLERTMEKLDEWANPENLDKGIG